jgi:hypothetical protein
MPYKRFLPQFRQASTWRGLIYCAAASGIVLSPEQMEAIVAAGMAIAGLIAVFLPDEVK